MSTSLLPIANVADLATAGQLLAQSGMFGAKNPAEGFVIAGMCQQAGISYLEYMNTYHFIGGRVTMKADAMLARFNAAGGKHVLLKRTDEEAAVEVEWQGRKTVFRFTWEEAKNEPFIYGGPPSAQSEQLKLPFEKRNVKDKYKTPRSRMQMLWARLVSDMVRCLFPQAVAGVYTPEEVSDFDDRGGSTVELSEDWQRQALDALPKQPQQTATPDGDHMVPSELSPQPMTFGDCTPEMLAFLAEYPEMTQDKREAAARLISK